MEAAESFAAIKVDVRDLPKAFEVITEAVDTDIHRYFWVVESAIAWLPYL
jgi:hypothetical protein